MASEAEWLALSIEWLELAERPISVTDGRMSMGINEGLQGRVTCISMEWRLGFAQSPRSIVWQDGHGFSMNDFEAERLCTIVIEFAERPKCAVEQDFHGSLWMASRQGDLYYRRVTWIRREAKISRPHDEWCGMGFCGTSGMAPYNLMRFYRISMGLYEWLRGRVTFIIEYWLDLAERPKSEGWQDVHGSFNIIDDFEAGWLELAERPRPTVRRWMMCIGQLRDLWNDTIEEINEVWQARPTCLNVWTHGFWCRIVPW